MVHKLFVIRDTCVGAYLLPMAFPSEGSARRAFSDEVNRVDEKNMMNRHPEHFQLYSLGEFDDETGLYTSFAPEFLVDAVSVLVVR